MIATRCGGVEDFVIDGETGLLVDRSAESMGRAIVALLGDGERRRNFAANARRLLDRDYSLQAMEQTFWRTFDDTFHMAD